MGTLKHISLLVAFALVSLASTSAASSLGAPENSLFAQSAAEILQRDFSDPNLSFLLLEVHSGRILASRWDNRDLPIPMGSLVKPFTALAYGEQHQFRFPTYVCRGTATGCWRPRGHGRVNLTSAIAYSCNSYFEALASTLSAHQVSLTSTDFGLQPPATSASGAALVGIGDAWSISPLRMARAYIELVRRRDQPGVQQIVDGMVLSAREGTAAAVDRALPYGGALTKTGTAPCTHEKRAPGDGFTVALWPADQPRILLLVRVHGVPGAQAAKVVGEMLRRIGE